MSTDPILIRKYNQVYREGEEKFWTFDSRNEQNAILKHVNFKDKFVLEIGCGTGDMAAKIITEGKARSVYAVDMSRAAINEARRKYPDIKNLIFAVGDFANDPVYALCRNKDVAVMIGVLEHTENPIRTLDHIFDKIILPGGFLAFSCPCFLNPRGYVWATLQILFGWPMSKTDKHMIMPSLIRDYCVSRGYKLLKAFSVDRSWGTGSGMIKDFNKRIPAAARDILKNIDASWPDEILKSRIGDLICWLENDLEYHKGHGANMVYIVKK